VSELRVGAEAVKVSRSTPRERVIQDNLYPFCTHLEAEHDRKHALIS
jgi:hypothetical protein